MLHLDKNKYLQRLMVKLLVATVIFFRTYITAALEHARNVL